MSTSNDFPFLRPEILAPCGDEETVRVALAAGADAVFFGVQDGFNARARATNLHSDNLANIVGEVHRAGAKAYLTMNTLIFEDERAHAARVIEKAARAGIDALIVQDPAVCALVREICPQMELHGSTQMTISSGEAARFAEHLGCTRVVVPRELSVKEIADFKARTPLELEVFIHGALCMSWSGQCLTSEAWGGRSANRGQCAQSCRMPYELIVDGEFVPTGDLQYLLSPLDLAGHRAIPELMRIGVHSLKIEGRLKGPAYVESAVRSLRRWIDHVMAGTHETKDAKVQLAEDLADATLAYSRGFSDGFFGGPNHQRLVPGRFPRSRGYLLGRVESIERNTVTVHASDAASDGYAAASTKDGRQAAPPKTLKSHLLKSFGKQDKRPLAPLPNLAIQAEQESPPVARIEPQAGMGVAFDTNAPETAKEPGGPLFGVEALPKDRYRLTFGRPGPDLRQVEPGQLVWITSSPKLQQAAQKLAEVVPHGRHALDLQVAGDANEPLRVTARWTDFEVTVESSEVLQTSNGRGLDAELLADKLGALGGTPFHLGQIDVAGLTPGLHLQVSALKKLRREFVDQLAPEVVEAIRRRPVVAPETAIRILDEKTAKLSQEAAELADSATPRLHHVEPTLIPLVRTPAQLEAVIEAGLKEVELDWMELVGLAQAVERAREAGLRVTIATTRVQKPGEEGFDRRIDALKPDAVLVRHWAGLMHFHEAGKRGDLEIHGDFSLNVTNTFTAADLLHLGLDTITASHDLNAEQLLTMLPGLPQERVTVVLHHHISTFHTEHCVYAATLSTGRDWRSCGRPCESHRVALRDHLGLEHPVIVDIGCRNTVFNARAQSAAKLVPQLLSSGVRRFRCEFVWESKEETLRSLQVYGALLRKEMSPRQVVEALAVHEQFGVTLGTMRA